MRNLSQLQISHTLRQFKHTECTIIKRWWSFNRLKTWFHAIQSSIIFSRCSTTSLINQRVTKIIILITKRNKTYKTKFLFRIGTTKTNSVFYKKSHLGSLIIILKKKTILNTLIYIALTRNIVLWSRVKFLTKLKKNLYIGKLRVRHPINNINRWRT